MRTTQSRFLSRLGKPLTTSMHRRMRKATGFATLDSLGSSQLSWAPYSNSISMLDLAIDGIGSLPLSSTIETLGSALDGVGSSALGVLALEARR